jgi:heptosyltransferase-2
VRCVVIQTAFLGDAILTLPLLDLLRKSATVSWLGALAAPEGADLLRLQEAADGVIEWDKRGTGGGIAGTARAVRALRDARADAAIIPHRSFRSALLAAAAGIPVRVGFDTSGGRFLMTTLVRYGARGHEVERVAGLAAGVGVAVPPGRIPFSVRVRGEDRGRVAAFLKAGGVGAATPVVLVAPGSLWPTKRWLPAGFAAAAETLARDLGAAVVLAGTRSDGPVARSVAAEMAEPPVDAVGRLGLGEWIALVERASLALSNDSAAAHVAAGVGTPVVAVFGPTVPDMGFAPYTSCARVLGAELACRPCGRHGHRKCPLGHGACMERVTVDDVVAAGRALVSRQVEACDRSSSRIP